MSDRFSSVTGASGQKAPPGVPWATLSHRLERSGGVSRKVIYCDTFRRDRKDPVALTPFSKKRFFFSNFNHGCECACVCVCVIF